jgi:hypothetical protein
MSADKLTRDAMSDEELDEYPSLMEKMKNVPTDVSRWITLLRRKSSLAIPPDNAKLKERSDVVERLKGIKKFIQQHPFQDPGEKSPFHRNSCKS